MGQTFTLHGGRGKEHLVTIDIDSYRFPWHEGIQIRDVMSQGRDTTTASVLPYFDIDYLKVMDAVCCSCCSL